eukprot:11187965-Prorocentrum_lima.AAC.1
MQLDYWGQYHEVIYQRKEVEKPLALMNIAAEQFEVFSGPVETEIPESTASRPDVATSAIGAAPPSPPVPVSGPT